ncbi:MAG: hypothetical protein VYC39_13955 [Myxococcota bacterium]|nr:hypothetical protein [Myxococcota bacterium]
MMRSNKKSSKLISCLLLAFISCGQQSTIGPEPEVAIEPTPEQNILLAASDVTFLIALRSVDNFTASTVGGYGTLLPRALFDQLDSLTVIDEPDVLYANLDIVGVRLDPCFFEGAGLEICSSQIRLVMQPVLLLDNSVSTRDATVHVFYEVPENEIRDLANLLRELRLLSNGDESIGLHPNPSKAAELVLPHIGTDRLSRVTFVSVHASDQAWAFGGIDIDGGNSTAIEIVGSGHHEQHLSSIGGTQTLDATILPPPSIEPSIAHFLSEKKRKNSTDAQLAEALAAFERILDPTEHNSGTVDCASCHMSTAAKRYSSSHEKNLEIGSAYANSQNQRMLGYFGNEPSISSRVKAETQVVVTRLRGE